MYLSFFQDVDAVPLREGSLFEIGAKIPGLKGSIWEGKKTSIENFIHFTLHSISRRYISNLYEVL